MQAQELKETLASLDTACFCDADKSIRVLDPGIHRINPGQKLIGFAHTVKCRDDFLTVIKALKDANTDEALVIDAGGGKKAVAGELFSTEAARKGLAGLIIDGACRDVVSIQSLSIPVYSKFVSPMAGTTKQVFDTQVPIVCGGVQVEPGEIVFGDDDGIIILSESEHSRLLPIALEIQRKEQEALRKMAEDESLLNMLNFDEHYDRRSPREESGLSFTIK